MLYTSRRGNAFLLRSLLLGIPLLKLLSAHPYDSKLVDYNINLNQTAGNDVLSYYADWPEKSKLGNGTGYTPSPSNWRELPTYIVILDRFADGDPTNNDFFKTMYEWDLNSNQLRHGGDIAGFADDRALDYIYGMGYRTIYFAGTPWVNMPWQYDGYSPLDYTLLDPHYGTLSEWRAAIDKIHSKGLYVMFDTTTTTLGDLLAFSGHFTSAAPFDIQGYEVEYKKTPEAPWDLSHYADFNYTNVQEPNCQLPKFYHSNGSEVIVPESPKSCYSGDFDQFGDSDTSGTLPPWMTQLTKYSSVQDRLREWDDNVAVKIEKLSCMILQTLDVDAIRVDKTPQQSVDFLAKWSTSLRKCAKSLGKSNFFIAGELVGASTSVSLYVGRGRQPVHWAGLNVTQAITMQPNQSENFMRPAGMNGLDSSAFHYSTYRSLTRLLGLDGKIELSDDISADLVDSWNAMMVTNDLFNQETGLFDPRHLFGTTNHDLFRWSALINGTEKFLLGQAITNLVMPGIPMTYYGEEQGLYLFDSQASDYLFGRQPMTSAPAWQQHGCYHLGSKKYSNFPLGRALEGCKDDWNSLDHLDPTSSPRHVLAHFAYIRSQFPSLQDGFNLTKLGNWTTLTQLPGSFSTPTEWGLWSLSRSSLSSFQNSSLPVWILYSNLNDTTEFTFDCSSEMSILAPYSGSTSVRNLMYPYEIYNLEDPMSPAKSNGDSLNRGCLRSITMKSYGFKVLVPQSSWIPPLPRLVGFNPGHDARILSDPFHDNHTVPITFQFSEDMSCREVASSISLSYTIDPTSNLIPTIDFDHAICSKIEPIESKFSGAPAATWSWSSSIINAADGVYKIQIQNATSSSGARTNSIDHLILRKGSKDNPITFKDVTYSTDLLHEVTSDSYKVLSRAAGADLMRYSTNFGKTYSNWTKYSPEVPLPSSAFDPTSFWEGKHVKVQYWSRIAGSAAQTVESDFDRRNSAPRKFPQLLLRGPYNQWGHDDGFNNKLLEKESNLTIDVVTSWPNKFQLTVFDSLDKFSFGDVDLDGTLDVLPPNSLAANFLFLPPPQSPFLGWRIMVNPASMTWGARPIGHQRIVLALFMLLMLIPPGSALLACWLFKKVFYGVRFNKYGVSPPKKSSLLPSWYPFRKTRVLSKTGAERVLTVDLTTVEKKTPSESPGRWPDDITARRKVLIATLEYEIPEWDLKVKIGGLGVMSSLMGRAMSDVELLWVIPKVGDIEYPTGDITQPIEVIIFGEPYMVECQIFKSKNVTYFILDAPVFRANTKSNPYPPRMDDLSSAIFYSYWNQSIAEICRRIPDLDIYHINDYHGSLAPLYLLPSVLPVCLSLHNAEFQGLWPLGKAEEEIEVCRAFNLDPSICSKYVRFGNVFNLLHAAASFISFHQNSVGVAGVSEKYGKRSWARYPALWTLKSIDSLPNPDPTDIDALEASPRNMKEISIDHEMESQRPENKAQLQEWAGLEKNPSAQLFVFVGRWSLQKGVDLIADVFTSILDKRKDVQLITVGPVIDLYGRFAAAKLGRLMELYPGRVFSKPEFTSLPPFVFSGSDFALIPSRDEPFGLVAVEFGRKGALGIGSRLGGLGLMPGWWFPVESDSTAHMHSQFIKAIKSAMSSSEEDRALLRARSLHQRFPVLEWRFKLQDMHLRAIKASRKYSKRLPLRTENLEPSQSLKIYEDFHDGASSSKSPTTNFGLGSENQFFPSRSSLFNSPYLTPNITQQNLTIGQTSSNTPQNAFRRAINVFRELILKKPDLAPKSVSLTNGPHTHHQSTEKHHNSVISSNIQEFLPSIIRVEEDETRRNNSSYDFKKQVARQLDTSSPLNKIVKGFEDEDGSTMKAFSQKLESLDPTNSQTGLCIADYLSAAEKSHFKHLRQGTLALAKSRLNHSLTLGEGTNQNLPSSNSSFNSENSPITPNSSEVEKDIKYPTDSHTALEMNLWQVRLQKQFFWWPLYTILLAFGQILGATSFQLSLLSGTSSRSTSDLYVIGAVNIFGSIFWYFLKSRKPATWSLSLPWIFFGMAFMFIGIPSLSEKVKVFSVRHPLSLVAAIFYSFASAAGFLFFSSNFGEEAGGSTSAWVYRACIVQGTQQIWVAALWYWGFKLQATDPVDTAFAPKAWINFITLTLAGACFFIAYVLFQGLPKYYRNAPGTVPNFVKALFRRKLVLWYLAAEVLRNYWLSGPYGRNWTFLWTGPNLPFLITLLLLLFFFVGVWGASLKSYLSIGSVWLLARAAKRHSWVVAIFAVGLGAPRWCQMLWSTSSVASQLGWAGGAGPYLAISLWLWLGVLDAIQGVGLGMILLQTLSRVHVAATLCLAQIIGSTAVLVARATAPNRIGPGSVFPNLGLWDSAVTARDSPLASWQFWIALLCQLIIVIGYFALFRREVSLLYLIVNFVIPDQ
ncbi:hypothetical protein BY996DRAFT_4584668 [Phakopsora pachyrhizi]|uniref:alpha-1,3-glucan synthase n=1 Tax=Phakopsora pachyrhizi TaxID=170000 RepID=A0AAV0BHN8_PHAPC|nr:hypothetical protein BY996DRAFT_4584668 [Phakopsora pachyrhizi]CAH7686420.1 hypothetical protein PPACK8108_LOCUS21065 [Phakopsora pachyrhizi]